MEVALIRNSSRRVLAVAATIDIAEACLRMSYCNAGGIEVVSRDAETLVARAIGDGSLYTIDLVRVLTEIEHL